jgi:hypothetical protein
MQNFTFGNSGWMGRKLGGDDFHIHMKARALLQNISLFSRHNYSKCVSTINSKNTLDHSFLTLYSCVWKKYTSRQKKLYNSKTLHSRVDELSSIIL